MWGEGTVPIPSCRLPSRNCGNPGVKCQKTEPGEEGECCPPTPLQASSSELVSLLDPTWGRVNQQGWGRP